MVSSAYLKAARHCGDPLADSVVDELMADGDVARVNALLHNLILRDQPVPDSLPPVVEFYLERPLLPADADLTRIESAQRFFQLWGLPISMSLFCASLPSAYAAANGVKVLYETARLQTDTRRRVFETGQFLMDVMAPGSFGPKGKAIRTIQRIRLMHAAVRRLILSDGTWRTDAWGYPINQEDLAGTMLSFSYVVGEPLPRLGINVTVDDANNYIYAWNVIAQMLGVEAALCPNDLDEAATIVAAIRQDQNAASPEGAAMTAALIGLLEEMTPHIRAREVGHGRLVPDMIRHLIGDHTADLIAVPDPRHTWRRVFDPLLRPLGWVESEVERHARLQRVFEPFARELLVSVFHHERGGLRAPFAIPDQLARTWELSS